LNGSTYEYTVKPGGKHIRACKKEKRRRKEYEKTGMQSVMLVSKYVRIIVAWKPVYQRRKKKKKKLPHKPSKKKKKSTWKVRLTSEVSFFENECIRADEADGKRGS